MQRYGGRKRKRRSSRTVDSGSGGRLPTADSDAVPRELLLPPILSVKQLADKMACDPIEVIKELIRNGVMANINQAVDFDTAVTVATELGFTATPLSELEEELSIYSELDGQDDPDNLVARPPVVTILGHVDHSII